MNKDENGCTRVKGTPQSLACHLQGTGSRYSLREESLNLPSSQICTLTPLLLDIVLSQMHKFSHRPASSRRLRLGKPALIPSVPDFPVPFWSFYLIRLIQGWTRQREQCRQGACLSPYSPPLAKGSFSLTMACWVFLSCFLSELTFCLDSFLASSPGKNFEKLKWTKDCWVSFQWNAELNTGLYPCLWLRCNFVNGRKLRLVMLVPRIAN